VKLPYQVLHEDSVAVDQGARACMTCCAVEVRRSVFFCDIICEPILFVPQRVSLLLGLDVRSMLHATLLQ
jgi:hypothetical protein